ncbi:MAG: saccharopine dehydrogenase NADP-binding domain-containing protein [Deltaproteobacteria bacterium]|nr:saccharopine dehydrogenase NADP-binding domain-containing protein [Deltaproteobacteria bacterium]
MSKYDIVVFGASGFTGARTAKYLAKDHGLRLAIAGRSKKKLEAVASTLGRDVGIIEAASEDHAAIDRMAAAARVVVTTAGPYARYGTPVVDACVAHGAHYADITGETAWVRDMIDKHHHAARQKRVKIVPFCGFDSVPSDLGAFLAATTLRRSHGEACRKVEAFFTIKGGVNGGSFATMLNFGETGEQRRMALPFLLSEGPRPNARVEKESRDVRSVFRHAKLDRWVSPFVMGTINTRVVRRSHSLLTAEGQGYGEDFVYQEYQASKSRAAALAMTAGLAAINALVSRPLTRRLLEKVGPKPGVGPSEAAIENGFFRTTLLGTGDSGGEVWVELSGQGDPGNWATVRFLGESALALAEGRDLPERYGVLTPASGIGEVLADRLRRAGLKVDVTPKR